MPKYVIERTLPGAGALNSAEWNGIAQKSNEAIESLAGRVQWLQSYVTDEKLYCIYIADDAEAVAEHASVGGFPCNDVRQVRRVIDPTTGE